MKKTKSEKYLEKAELPHSIIHEKAVLNALIKHNTNIKELDERGINQKHFYSDETKEIYRICKILSEKGVPFDYADILGELTQNRSADKMCKTLTQIVELDSHDLDTPSHINKIDEFYQRRLKALDSLESYKEAFINDFSFLYKKDLISSLESWKDIQDMDIKIEWIVNRLIPKGSITLVYGKGGIGKTWLLLQIARCIGSGEPWLGFDTIKLPVVYVDFENPLAVLNHRTQILGNAENVTFWRGYNKDLPAPKLDSYEWIKYKTLPEGSVLVFDTLRASQSRDENASDQMGLIMNRLKELRDLGHTIILMHHTAKNSEKVPKGSTAIVDLADHILGVFLVRKTKDGEEVIEDDDDDEANIYRFGVFEKTRYSPHHVYLTLDPDKGFEIAPDPQEDLLKAMHGILIKHDTLKMTDFTRESRESLNLSKNKARKLVDIGAGRYWEIEEHKSEKNAKFVIPKSV